MSQLRVACGIPLLERRRRSHSRAVAGIDTSDAGMLALRTLSTPHRTKMTETAQTEQQRSRLRAILTDVHFWVPVGVLIAGLLLLKFIS